MRRDREQREKDKAYANGMTEEEIGRLEEQMKQQGLDEGTRGMR